MPEFIELEGYRFQAYITQNQIREKITTLANQIAPIHQQKNLLFLPVMNGALFFAADLMNELASDVSYQSLRIKTYQGLKSVHEPEVMGLSEEAIEGRHVMILEDLVDTGKTTDFLRAYLGKLGASSVQVASLIFKKSAFRGKFPPDYYGFECPNLFLLGYGMDVNEKGRNLKDIYKIKN